MDYLKCNGCGQNVTLNIAGWCSICLKAAEDKQKEFEGIDWPTSPNDPRVNLVLKDQVDVTYECRQCRCERDFYLLRDYPSQCTCIECGGRMHVSYIVPSHKRFDAFFITFFKVGLLVALGYGVAYMIFIRGIF